MKWKIIKESEDIKELVEFDQHVHPRTDWVSAVEYDFWVKRDLKIYVLEDSEWIGVFQILETSNGVIFHGFGVSPKYRGQGYGQVLMDKLVLTYSDRTISCKTKADNVRMIELLEKNQFERKSTVTNDGELWSWWMKCNAE